MSLNYIWYVMCGVQPYYEPEVDYFLPNWVGKKMDWVKKWSYYFQ